MWYPFESEMFTDLAKSDPKISENASFKVSLESNHNLLYVESPSAPRINTSNKVSPNNPYSQLNNKTVYAHVSKGSFEIGDEEVKNMSAIIDGEISTLIKNKRILKKTDHKKR